MKKGTVLVADDEKMIVKLISDFLTASDYDVITAEDGRQALEMFESQKESISLAIIDIMMPEIDGWELTRRIRKKSDLPIIMLSARSEDFDLLSGYEAGIDEYVTKPFSPTVLVKRVDAVLKRYQSSSSNSETARKGLYIDEAAYNVFLDGKVIEFTLKEFELLLHLYKNKGIVLTRDRLLDLVWGYDYFGDNRTVDSHIARIRTKLGDWGMTHLKTVYGMGYKLEL